MFIWRAGNKYQGLAQALAKKMDSLIGKETKAFSPPLEDFLHTPGSVGGRLFIESVVPKRKNQ